MEDSLAQIDATAIGPPHSHRADEIAAAAIGSIASKFRPHSALGYRPPAPAAISPAPLSGMIMSPALS